MKECDNVKSYCYEFGGYEPRQYNAIEIKGKKKRVFFDYNMEDFFNEIQSVR